MIFRTWPYGTRKVVNVLDFVRVRNTCYVICQHVDDPTEATTLLCSARSIAALFVMPAVGQRRVIEFRRGGPTGGFWEMLDGLDTSRAQPEVRA